MLWQVVPDHHIAAVERRRRSSSTCDSTAPRQPLPASPTSAHPAQAHRGDRHERLLLPRRRPDGPSAARRPGVAPGHPQLDIGPLALVGSHRLLLAGQAAGVHCRLLLAPASPVDLGCWQPVDPAARRPLGAGPVGRVEMLGHPSVGRPRRYEEGGMGIIATKAPRHHLRFPRNRQAGCVPPGRHPRNYPGQARECD